MLPNLIEHPADLRKIGRKDLKMLVQLLSESASLSEDRISNQWQASAKIHPWPNTFRPSSWNEKSLTMSASMPGFKTLRVRRRKQSLAPRFLKNSQIQRKSENKFFFLGNERFDFFFVASPLTYFRKNENDSSINFLSIHPIWSTQGLDLGLIRMESDIRVTFYQTIGGYELLVSIYWYSILVYIYGIMRVKTYCQTIKILLFIGVPPMVA